MSGCPAAPSLPCGLLLYSNGATCQTPAATAAAAHTGEATVLKLHAAAEARNMTLGQLLFGQHEAQQQKAGADFLLDRQQLAEAWQRVREEKTPLERLTEGLPGQPCVLCQAGKMAGSLHACMHAATCCQCGTPRLSQRLGIAGLIHTCRLRLGCSYRAAVR